MININLKILLKKIILLINDLKNDRRNINLIRNEEEKDVINTNNIYINDKNKKFLEKLFLIMKKKLGGNDYIYNITFKKLKLYDESLIELLHFFNINNLYIFEGYLNLSCLKNLRIKDLDLSETTITNIETINQIKTLIKLNLSKNHISNLSLLEDAQFTDLEELNLSYNGIKDLYSIKMDKYKFYNLNRLNLSHNQIEELEPIKIAFKKLKYLDITYNRIIEFYIIKDTYIKSFLKNLNKNNI